MLQPLNDFQFGLLIAGTLVAMLVGLLGVIVPVAPGLILIWAAALAYGVLAGFSPWGYFYLAVMTVLMGSGYGLSTITSQMGAAKTGASWQANTVGCLLSVVGFFIVPVIGAIIGALLGVFLVEWYRSRELVVARKAAVGTFVGFLAGYGVQVVVACLMISVWGIWVVAEGLNLF